MAQRYAHSMLIYMLCVFYAPLISIVPVIGCVGNIFSYWIEKCLLLKRHRRPEEMGSSMAFFFANSMPWFMLLFAVSNFVWVDELSLGNNAPGLVGLILMLIYIVLPVRSYINNRFSFDIARFDEHTYSKNKQYFLTDYRTENPMTKDEEPEDDGSPAPAGSAPNNLELTIGKRI